MEVALANLDSMEPIVNARTALPTVLMELVLAMELALVTLASVETTVLAKHAQRLAQLKAPSDAIAQTRAFVKKDSMENCVNSKTAQSSAKMVELVQAMEFVNASMVGHLWTALKSNVLFRVEMENATCPAVSVNAMLDGLF